LLHGTRTAARQERKHSNLVGAAAGLHLLLRETHPGNLGSRVDHRRNRLVVDLGIAARNQVGHHAALLITLVRQHRAAHAVSDRPDALGTRATFVIDLDETALIELHAG